jgi:type I restriction enzyme S subunit
MIIFRPDHKKLLSRYLYLFLRSHIFKSQAKALSTGSAQPQLPIRDINRINIPIPPLPEQKAIAHILGTLDDKIELNRRMNETLEAMARAIFKSWFVDFDPVRAKMEGLQPSDMDAKTATLFPDSVEDSPLGKIPKGWYFATIGTEFNLIMGQSPPGETYNEIGEGLPFFQGRTDFGFRFPTQRVYCTAPTRQANPGDTMVSVRAPVGDINMASETCCIGRGVAAIRHKSGSRSYTFYMMHSLRDTFADFEAEGTVFGCINKDDFQGIKCITPPAELVKKYEQTAFPLDEAIRNNDLSSHTLAATRDALLPKLLVGEIRVKDVQSFLEAFTEKA